MWEWRTARGLPFYLISSQPGSARLGSARLDSARLGSALGPGQYCMYGLQGLVERY